MIEGSKPATQSVTLWGALVGYATVKAAPLLSQFGITDPQLQNQIICQVLEVAFLLVAVGRANVTKTLRGGLR